MANANPWQRVAVGALMDLPYYHCGVAYWRETVCAMQVAATKEHATLCDALGEAGTKPRDALERKHARPIRRPITTALTERATMALHQVMLVRLSDALTEAAVDTTQDWFMIDLRNDQDALPVTVGDLLAFGVKIV